MTTSALLKEESIAQQIFFIRAEKVMMDFDLAKLYNVETKTLKRAVKRNLDRFPPDFMFEISQEEYKTLRYQNGTIKQGRHSKYLPYAITEQGVAMLSGVLKSKRAIDVNIVIMRTFVNMRRLLMGNKELAQKIRELERMMQSRISDHDKKFQLVFEAIRQLMQEKSKPRKAIGFRARNKLVGATSCLNH